MKKNLLVFALASIMVFGALTGCGSASTDTDTPAADSSGGNDGDANGSGNEPADNNNGSENEPAGQPEGNTEVKPEVQGNYKDGTYTGTGKGNNGDISVEVIVEGGNITTINVTAQSETPGIYEKAQTGVTSSMIKSQTSEVDTVSGATNSSKGIKEAVANALETAK